MAQLTIQGLRDTAAARWRQFLVDPTPQGVLRRSLVILATVTVITAWFSETFFFPDEHFQILEFMAMKLGLTSPADLPWEYGAKLRPFFQPFVYFLIAKPLMALGLGDVFDVMFALRLVTGAFSLAALAVFARFLLEQFSRPDERFAFARMLPFMGFLPYLFVRTASETAAAAFFAFALVVALRGVRSRGQMALAGLFCGAAFECRYQTAFLVIGLFAWLAIEARARWAVLASLVAGGLVVLALALLIDRWGYGVWCFPPWTYVDVNIFQGLAAKQFGAAPWYAYFYLESGTIFAPISFVLMAAMVVACLRNPRNVITWVTVPFFLAHCLIAHKEERFLFPLTILAISYPVLAFAPGRPFPVFERVWKWRTAAKIVGWSAVLAMLFLAVYPFGIRPHMRMAKYLYRNFPSGFHAYSFDDQRFENYPMARPYPYRIDLVTSRDALQAPLAHGPIYVISDTPSVPVMAQGLRATLLYSDFVLAGSPRAAEWATKVMCGYANLKHTTPIHPPRLRFLTLYKMERGAAARTSTTTPCTPVWN